VRYPPPDHVTEEAFAVIRSSLLAGAVALLVVPALAGCEAGLNAPTLEFHQASFGAHDSVGGIIISNAFVLAAPSGQTLQTGSDAGLFLGLFNNGSSADTLTSVSLPDGGATSVTITGGSVTVPGNAGVNLTGPTPKIVLHGLTKPLSGGGSIEVELTFQNAGSTELLAPVEPQSFYYSTLSQPPSPSAAVTPSANGAASVSPSATATATATTTPTPSS
jgi:copper(I)-binding protein